MSVLAQLAQSFPKTPAPALFKAALLFTGVRFHPCLAEAADWAFPAYWPYMLEPGEPAFRGKRQLTLPHLVVLPNGTLIRLRVKPDSPFIIRPGVTPRNFELYEGDTKITELTFEARHPWTTALTADGTPMKATGLSQHGDMLVLNVSPGCEYFVVPKGDGSGKTENLSCSFCLYGLPDKVRLEPLGQKLYEIEVPNQTMSRVADACSHPETHARHLYLVGGSMLSMDAEGERYVQMARFLAEKGLMDRYYVACGSGAINRKHMLELKDAGVRGACFNLEVWDPALFKKICPGKDKIVGRQRWLDALEEAVDVFGRGNVMSAFVGGIELETDGGFTSPKAAMESNLEAGEYLIPRGIQAVFSLHWRVAGKHRNDEPIYSLEAFLDLNDRLAALRKKEKLFVNEEFYCQRCAYMQLEPDYDLFAKP